MPPRNYGILKSLDNHCIGRGLLLDKKVAVEKKDTSSHLILWISSELSTDTQTWDHQEHCTFFEQAFESRFLVLQKRFFEHEFQNDKARLFPTFAARGFTLKSMYTSLVVVVNRSLFLWIRQQSVEKSMT